MKPALRQFLLLLCALIAASGAIGQPAPGVHRIGFINAGPAAPNAKNAAAFKAGMAELGYVEGRNLEIDFVWGDQKVDRLPAMAAELVRRKPAVIVSTGGAATVRAVKGATTTIPVVFISGSPIAEQIVPSLARPGGNLTGFSVLAGDLEAKRLEMLTLLLPRARRVAIIWNSATPYVEDIVRGVESAAVRLDLKLVAWKATSAADLEKAFGEITESKFDALFVVVTPSSGSRGNAS